MTVTLTGRGVRLGGREVPLVSGEVHFWRLDPRSWAPVLDRVAELGFRFVSTYVPWCVHEVAPGRFDFSGPRDLERFLGLAGERGLGAVVRPGPNAGAELPTSGWPRRILDDPRCQARRCTGAPYLLVTATHHAFMPSYASRVVLDEVARWYDAVVPRLAALQYPRGPVMACQVDNEMGYHFQAHPYALDYHPEALAQFREWLLARYGGLDELNRAWGTRYGSLAHVDPPRDGSEEPELRRVDWVTFREEHLRRSLRTLAGMLRERGMDRVPLLHNDYARTATPQDPGALERSGAVDVAAGDVYATKEGGRFVRDFVRHLAGATRFPFLAELGAGWLALPWLLPVATTPLDEEVVTLRALLGGAAGANVYMLVERDRWYGSPIARDGTAREPRASFYHRLHRLLEELDWTSLQRWAPVLLVENRTEARRAAARSVGGGAVACLAQLVPVDPRLFEGDDRGLGEWTAALARVLDDAGVDHDRASSSSLPDLTRYEVVLMPVLEAADPVAWDQLLQAARRGVRVAVGPRFPVLDDRLRPSRFDPGPIRLLRTPADAAQLLPVPPLRSPADLHLYRRPGGGEVLAAFNPGPQPLRAPIRFEGRARLRGRWREEVLEGEGEVLAELPPWGVQVWEVER